MNKPLIVGLTTNPDRLVQVRLNRLLQLHEKDETTYTDMDIVIEEVRYARRIYAQNNWPVIDVTRRSIEETAASIMNLISNREMQEAKS